VFVKTIACYIFLALGTAVLADDPWADIVVDASDSLDGSGPHNDPQSVLGEPTRSFYDPTLGAQLNASVVAGPFYKDAPDGNKVVTTIHAGEFIKVRFDEPLRDDSDNPFGLDLIVFGNAFFVADGFIGPDTDMESVNLTGVLFAEPVTVAVSQSGIGDPQSDPDQWYVYEGGPFADGLFPTSAFLWDRCNRNWGSKLSYTKPVDPSLTVSDFADLTAADAIDMYHASGGGTGYDLGSSGFAWIQFVYITSDGGEVDALADVSPGGPFAADIDRDGDVDLNDFAHLQTCFTGDSGDPISCECLPADLNDDDKVDLDDLALLVSDLTGPK